MADRHARNAPGSWYVDVRCINCGAATDLAPGLIVEAEGQSVFARQPHTEAELMMAWRARLACPTASLHSEQAEAQPAAVFPEALTADVWRLGYNARASWGAHSFLIRRADGNAMVDSPRWTPAVEKAIAERGGLREILLTHRDDVADAERYMRAFGARAWIHEADRAAAPFAQAILTGTEPVEVAADLLAIPVPGHTAGSVAYLHDGHHLFTGDTLAWDVEAGDLTAWREVCWHSWPEQLRSLGRLLDHETEWIFAGHGGSMHLPAPEMRARLAALIARLKADPAPQ